MTDMRIKQLHAREIIDCRGLPTVEVEAELECGARGRAGVPSGFSTSVYEAYELRDTDKTRYRGRGVKKAVANVNEQIAPALLGQNAGEQRQIDQLLIDLDGTPDKSRLGGNAVVGASMAVVKAAADATHTPLYRYINSNARVIPVPLFNLINGGKHASGNLEIQEFIIMPVGAENLFHALQIATEVSFELRDRLVERYGKIAVNLGDEGGFVPPMHGAREPLDALVEAVEAAGYSDLIVYGMDCAASHFYDEERNIYHFDGEELTRDDMIKMFQALCSEYRLASIEDALDQSDLEGWVELTRAIPDVQWVGDDLFATNSSRLLEGIRVGAANAVLWKINQIGTLTEALDTAELAYRHGYGVQVSERSGETEDPVIADFTVALNAGQIKTGAPVRGERTSKYNQLLRIEEELGEQAVYAGRNFRWPG
jgi:enolase